MLRLTSKTVTGGAAAAFLSRLGPGIGAASNGLSLRLRPLGGGGDAAAVRGAVLGPETVTPAKAVRDLELDFVVGQGGKATWRVLFLAVTVFSYAARLVDRDGTGDEVEEARAGRELPVGALRPVDIDNA